MIFTKGLFHFDGFCSAAWKALSEEDKVPFAKLADKDKKRYAKEMTTYAAHPTCTTQPLLAISCSPTPHRRLSRDSDAMTYVSCVS